MKKRFTPLCLLLAFITFSSCEKDREPFTLEELFEINGLPTKRFELRLNGLEFETDLANGLKTNTAFGIEASGSKVSYALSISDVVEGAYFGNTDESKVFLNYRDANGTLFSTTKQGVRSDLNVVVSLYNVEKSVISGNFSGTLMASQGNLQLQVSNGSFLEVPVAKPAFGEMTARVGNRSFVAESCSFKSTNSGGFIFETFLGVGNGDSTSVNITVEQKIEEREYQFSAGALTATYNSNTFSSNTFKNQYNGESGKLLIMAIDTLNNTVQGSFNFTVRNAFGEPIDIREGNFNALIK